MTGAYSASIWHPSSLLALEPGPKPQLPGWGPDSLPMPCQNTLLSLEGWDLSLFPSPSCCEGSCFLHDAPYGPRLHEDAYLRWMFLCPEILTVPPLQLSDSAPRKFRPEFSKPWVVTM